MEIIYDAAPFGHVGLHAFGSTPCGNSPKAPHGFMPHLLPSNLNFFTVNVLRKNIGSEGHSTQHFPTFEKLWGSGIKDTKELAEKADEIFAKVNGGPFTGDEGAVRKQIMKGVKVALKADEKLASVRPLIDAFHNGATFFPNNTVKQEVTKGNGGIIAVNTFPVICENNHLKREGDRWRIEESSNTVGGDPTMPLIQAAALGHKTNLITIVPKDRLGEVYVKRIQEAGVNVIPVWVDGESPVQFNFAHNGTFMGGIRLKMTPPIPREKIAEVKRKLIQVLGSIKGYKAVLVGGASNTADDQNVFGELLQVAKDNGAIAAYDTKDSHMGSPKEGWKVEDLPLVRNFAYSDISKPNEGEAYILEQVLVKGRRDLDKIGGEARDISLQKQYWEEPQRLVEVARRLNETSEDIVGDKDHKTGTIIFTLGAQGAVVIGDDLKPEKYEKVPESVLTDQGLKVRSPQGGGNAFWAQLMIGQNTGEKLEESIPKAQVTGLLSTHQLGNGCADPSHIRNARIH